MQTVPVTLLLFRASKSPIASLSSLFVLVPDAHLRPHLHLQFVMDQQLSGCEVEHVHR